MALCFVNVHLAAGRALDKRQQDVVQILRKLSVADADLVSEFHALFWMGDLNFRWGRARAWWSLFFAGVAPGVFRISLPTPDVLAATESLSWERLVEHDELTRLRLSKRLFVGFSEGALYFPPTYARGCVLTGLFPSGRAGTSTRSAPTVTRGSARPLGAFLRMMSVSVSVAGLARTRWFIAGRVGDFSLRRCDRILWRTRAGVFMQQTCTFAVCPPSLLPVQIVRRADYNHVKDMVLSDHKPVKSSFRVGYPSLLTVPRHLRDQRHGLAVSMGLAERAAEEAFDDTDPLVDWMWRIQLAEVVCAGARASGGLPPAEPHLTVRARCLAELQPEVVTVAAAPQSAERHRVEWHCPPLFVRAAVWSQRDLAKCCLVVSVRDNALLGDDDFVGAAAVELQPAIEAAPGWAAFEVPLLRDTAYNGFLAGRVSISRVDVGAAAAAARYLGPSDASSVTLD